jgi:hypothetical protein
MSAQREERPGENELDTEQKKHIEQPAQKDQEQSNPQPEIQQEPDPRQETHQATATVTTHRRRDFCIQDWRHVDTDSKPRISNQS